METLGQDLTTIGLLVFLEGILSIDNALAIALIAKHLPPAQQRRALTYGLVGAFAFRFAALAVVGYLMRWVWVKYIGGAYLLWMALAHFLKPKPDTGAESDQAKKSTGRSFWATVAIIELTDIAFAVDSILAAVAISNKLWVVVTGGILGVIMMRFAASVFIHLLKRFPELETTAYLLILGVGLKLVLQGLAHTLDWT
jgi:YkoY family integral membrane protein